MARSKGNNWRMVDPTAPPRAWGDYAPARWSDHHEIGGSSLVDDRLSPVIGGVLCGPCAGAPLSKVRP